MCQPGWTPTPPVPEPTSVTSVTGDGTEVTDQIFKIMRRYHTESPNPFPTISYGVPEYDSDPQTGEAGFRSGRPIIDL